MRERRFHIRACQDQAERGPLDHRRQRLLRACRRRPIQRDRCHHPTVAAVDYSALLPRRHAHQKPHPSVRRQRCTSADALHERRVRPPQVLSENNHPCKRSPSEPPWPNLGSRQRHHSSPACVGRLHQQLHHALRPQDVLVIPRRGRCPALLAMPVRRQAAGLRLRLQHVVSLRADHRASARVVVKRSLGRDMSLRKGCDLAAQRTRTPWPMRPWIRRLEAAHVLLNARLAGPIPTGEPVPASIWAVWGTYLLIGEQFRGARCYPPCYLLRSPEGDGRRGHRACGTRPCVVNSIHRVQPCNWFSTD